MTVPNTHANTQPFVRVIRRTDIKWPKAWAIRLISLLLSLIVCAGVIYAIVKLNPLRVYVSMFNGAFGTTRKSWVTIRDAMTLLCIGVALAPAFKMRFWNIGAEGQILVGGVATAACMIYLGKSLPAGLLLVLMAAVSLIAGALWGLLPAVFKARWNTNETLFTLMMNYVAIQLTSYFVAKWENPFGSNSVGVINPDGREGWFPELFGQTYGLNVLIVLVLAALMYGYMRRTKHGYELDIVGRSESTARYAGMNTGKIYIRTMLLSSALCGLTGFIAVAGSSHTISTDTAGGRGFTAIIVAWLAKFNTLVMIVLAFLLVFLDKGARQIASEYSLNSYASEMITGIILFFILGSEFFINYKLVFRKGSKEA